MELMMPADTKRHRLLIEQLLSQARESRLISENTQLPRPARIRALGFAEGLEHSARKLQVVLEELGREADVSA